jgi:CO/xanthine dehydrogenase Mo-binding subunit
MKLAAVSGIALGMSRLVPAQAATFSERDTLAARGIRRPTTGRIDGIAKATGAKLYASDFRATDLPGWPRATSHALLLRTPDASHVYTGFDLEALKAVAAPSVVVTADDVARAKIRVPGFYAGDLFCPVGKTPVYLGQPVALLIFETAIS